MSLQSVGAVRASAQLCAPAFQQVFHEYRGYICRVIRRFGVPERDLEDVAHDTFIVVHRKLVDYNPEQPLKPWLFGIAYRVSLAYRRRAINRAGIAEQQGELVDHAPTAEEALSADACRQLVMLALDALDDDRRAIFVLHELEQLPIPQVAIALDVPLNTVYSRLRSARELFERAVQRLTKGNHHA